MIRLDSLSFPRGRESTALQQTAALDRVRPPDGCQDSVSPSMVATCRETWGAMATPIL